ncbi:MAG: c-type cytochrome [Alphaproteobacteria bacterium]
MKKHLPTVLALGLLLAVPAHAADGDATTGANLFKTRCAICHTPDQNRVGPKLGGVFGRKAGAISDYSYSSALKASGLTWDAATLDKWLTGPAVLVSGTKMALKLDNPQDRADIIAYLKTLVAK